MLRLFLLAAANLVATPAQARSLEEALASVVSVLPEWPPDATRTEEPEASGVVILDGRTVVTALHVIDKARAVRVRTSEGEVLEARIVAHDAPTDLAILEIPIPLPPIAFIAQEPRLGSPVCAIGNAFGLGLSVTCGVVSGLHQAGVGFNPIEDFVQTDAAVNPGASGGALVSRDGELVGLLSAIFTKKSDANVGVNFAVDAALVAHVAGDLKQHGRVRRVSTGLRLTASPGAGGTGRPGARVASVSPGSAASLSGLKQDDLILVAAGRRVRKPADFTSALAKTTPPSKVELRLLRGGQELTVTLDLSHQTRPSKEENQ